MAIIWNEPSFLVKHVSFPHFASILHISWIDPLLHVCIHSKSSASQRLLFNKTMLDSKAEKKVEEWVMYELFAVGTQRIG